MDMHLSCLLSMARDRSQLSPPLESHQIVQADASCHRWKTLSGKDGAVAFGGGFYWMERGTDRYLWAAARCTSLPHPSPQDFWTFSFIQATHAMRSHSGIPLLVTKIPLIWSRCHPHQSFQLHCPQPHKPQASVFCDPKYLMEKGDATGPPNWVYFICMLCVHSWNWGSPTLLTHHRCNAQMSCWLVPVSNFQCNRWVFRSSVCNGVCARLMNGWGTRGYHDGALFTQWQSILATSAGSAITLAMAVSSARIPLLMTVPAA